MKYIITENKLNNIILKYLDTKLDGIEEKEGAYLYIVFAFPNEKYGILGYNRTGDLIVHYKLVKEISDLFVMKYVDSERMIGKWVEDRFNKKVINIYTNGTDLHMLKVGTN